MLDGEGNPTEQVRGALYAARRTAKKGRNTILIYLIEAALEELEDAGLKLPDKVHEVDGGAA